MCESNIHFLLGIFLKMGTKIIFWPVFLYLFQMTKMDKISYNVNIVIVMIEAVVLVLLN